MDGPGHSFSFFGGVLLGWLLWFCFAAVDFWDQTHSLLQEVLVTSILVILIVAASWLRIDSNFFLKNKYIQTKSKFGVLEF